jgi:hypothetical protein
MLDILRLISFAIRLSRRSAAVQVWFPVLEFGGVCLMGFRDPVAAYNAANNVQAHLVCGLLVDTGIEAKVIEDVSQIGVWIGGLVPEIHKPQVWIDRADIERAAPILAEYDQRIAARETALTKDEVIEIICDECGMLSSYPAAQNGSVQNCPHCRAFVDVGTSAAFEGWDADSEE